MRVRCGWLAGVLVLCFACPALGQTPALGSVRVVFPGGEAVVGQLVSAGGDSVVIRDSQGERRSYLASSLTRLDVRRRGSRLENSILGFGGGLVGMTVGMVIVAVSNVDQRYVFLTSLCLPVGMVVGYAAPRGTQWEQRPVPRVSLNGSGVQVGFSLRVP
jgi:hypothetical protein